MEIINEVKISYKQKELYANEFAAVYLIEGTSILICEALKEYIPIESFKETFNQSTKLISKYKIDKFIFDKRNLRVFHQPSMEWYFVIWKTEIYLKYNLKTHRKILPQNLDWFKNAVKAGRSQIRKNYPHLIVDKLDIAYSNSIEDAIEN